LLFGSACGANSPPASGPGDVAEAGSAGDVSQVGAGEDQDEATGDLAEHHRHHSHGGFAMFIAMSLDGLGTSPDQDQAIAKIQADMHAKMAPAHDAEKAVLLVVADGVAAGAIDHGKLDEAMSQLATASAGVHDAVADSLDQLHATLKPEQRAALVQKVEAHFEVWAHVNSDDEDATKDAHGGHLAKLAKELSLTPDQVEQVRASFKQAGEKGGAHYDRAEADAHLKAFGEAFESETFEAKNLTGGRDVNAHMAVWGVRRMIRMYEALTPVLTPDQRAKVSDMIRRHANYKRTDDET
jgi:Spy/CpxP family protein refolding chaperone